MVTACVAEWKGRKTQELERQSSLWPAQKHWCHSGFLGPQRNTMCVHLLCPGSAAGMIGLIRISSRTLPGNLSHSSQPLKVDHVLVWFVSAFTSSSPCFIGLSSVLHCLRPVAFIGGCGTWWLESVRQSHCCSDGCHYLNTCPQSPTLIFLAVCQSTHYFNCG